MTVAGKQLTLTLLLFDGFCQIRLCLGPLGGNAILTCTLANEDEGLCNLSPDKPVAGSALDNWHRLRWEESGHMWLQLDNWQLDNWQHDSGQLDNWQHDNWQLDNWQLDNWHR